MCGPEDPLFTPLLPLARVPFQAKESVHKTPFWENSEILASTASIITQILAHKPPNLEIFSFQAPKFGNFQLTSLQIWKFSAHKPPFSEANVSSQKPHTSEIRAAHPYLKKVECPPPRARSTPRKTNIDFHGYRYILSEWMEQSKTSNELTEIKNPTRIFSKFVNSPSINLDKSTEICWNVLPTKNRKYSVQNSLK